MSFVDEHDSPMPTTLEDACREIVKLRNQLYLANCRRAELFLKLEEQRRSHWAALQQARSEVIKK